MYKLIAKYSQTNKVVAVHSYEDLETALNEAMGYAGYNIMKAVESLIITIEEDDSIIFKCEC